MKTDLPLPKGERQHSSTLGWLAAQDFRDEAGEAYILYADQSGAQFYNINHLPVSSLTPDHPLSDFIRANKMYSYTIVCYPIKSVLQNFQLTHPVSSELNYFLQQHPDANAVYVVAHKTGGHELLVSVGGDCYRPDRGDLLSMLTRTKDLATGMLRKASLLFPDIPALTGGKKGEFGVIDENHNSISKELSEEAIFQLSAWLMPIGIQFLNRKIK